MSMMEEIEKFMQSVDTSINYRLVNLGGKSLYVEGISNVVNFSDKEMRFQLKKKLLIIFGTNLNIKYLDKSSCVIIGEISGVEVK